jgi:hypothetical protein
VIGKRPFVVTITTACLLGGILAAAPISAATATASTTPTMTLTPVHPGLKEILGHVFVIYRSQRYGTADINDAITNVSSGEVATLYAQPFPYNKPPIALETNTVPPGGTSAMFSDPVTPTLATRYTATLYASSTSTTPLATSNVATVNVLGGGHVNGPKRCGRPVCHETFRLYYVVPPSTLKQEMTKRDYPYFGLNLDKHAEPPAPKWLRRGAGSARVTKARRISAREFEVTIRYSFRIGTHGYRWLWTACTKDSEARDGLNIPGSHGCGKLRIRTNVSYLG